MNDSYQDPSSGFYSSGTDNSHQRQESGPGGAPVMDNPYAREKMALTALILAVAAIITFQVFFVSMPLGISAVILALLSRGKDSMARRARVALCIGAIAASLSAAVTGYSVYTVMTDPQLRREFEKLYVYYTGQEFPFPAESGSGASSGTPDSALSQDPWVLLHYLMDPRTGLGRFREFRISNYDLMMELIGYCMNHSIDEILGNTDSPARKGGNYI